MPNPSRQKTGKKKVAKIVRQKIEDDLRDEFRDFLIGATREEKYFLLDVLRLWSNETQGPKEQVVTIAFAFELAIHDRGHYVCVADDDLFDAVMKFINDYNKRKYTGKFVPQADGWYLWTGLRISSTEEAPSE